MKSYIDLESMLKCFPITSVYKWKKSIGDRKLDSQVSAYTNLPLNKAKIPVRHSETQDLFQYMSSEGFVKSSELL